MATALTVIICLALALFGAWEVACHKHDRHDKPPDDIQ